MSSPFRGIFPVVLTPYAEDGSIDMATLAREVDFSVEAGTHGLVFPVLGSEFQYLSDAERRAAVEVVVRQAGGRVPVVAGVAAADPRAAAEHAAHAAGCGADAVIALPPYPGQPGRDELRSYYRAIAEAAGRPVFIQHTHAGMDAAFIERLLRDIPNVEYVKEESDPSAHQISALLARCGAVSSGVFGGAHGRWMLSELRRGATGFMPATELTDVHVQIWDAWHAGNRERAREMFNLLLPLINLLGLLGLPMCKEVLVRRGVFASTATRVPGSVQLDDEDHRELDAILAGLQPLLRV